MNGTKSSRPRVDEVGRELGILLDVGDLHDCARTQGSPARGAIVRIDPPEFLQEVDGKPSLSHDEEFMPARDLDIAIFRAMQGNDIVENGLDGAFNGAAFE